MKFSRSLTVVVVASVCSPVEAGPGVDHRQLETRPLARKIAVFGSDDRTSVPARLESIAGRLGLLFNNQTRSVCSAFCVAPNVIATAAHCLLGTRGGTSPRYNDFTFARNFDRMKEFSKIEGVQSSSAAQNIVMGDFKLKVSPPIDATRDWALVRLQRTACPGGLPIRAYNSDELIKQSDMGRTFQMSYHRDYRQWQPAYSTPCRIGRDFDKAAWTTIATDFIDAELMLLHTCDTGGASSGSPLLLETDAGPVVVGINVGTYVQSKVTNLRGKIMRQHADTIANTAVNATAFGHLVDLLSDAKVIASSTQMRELQQRLRLHNLYAGRIDGAFGPDLRAAIKAYERAANLPVTGLATQSLLSRLELDPSRSGEVAPTKASEPRPVR